MGTIEENRSQWQQYRWTEAGEEWSGAWVAPRPSGTARFCHGYTNGLQLRRCSKSSQDLDDGLSI